MTKICINYLIICSLVLIIHVNNSFAQNLRQKSLNQTVQVNNWHNMYLPVDSFNRATEFNLVCLNGDSIITFQAVIDPQKGDPYVQKVNGSSASKSLVLKLNTVQAGDRVIFDAIESLSKEGKLFKQPSVIYMLVD